MPSALATAAGATARCRARRRRAAAFALIAGFLLGANSEPSGREIYQRVVDNRFHSFTQSTTLISADRGGRRQESRFQMHWKDFRAAENSGNGQREGLLSKTLVRYTHPFDLRHSGYLIQQNQDRLNDQFVYYPSRRQVVRVSLRNEAIYGTDFSFEDVIPREVEEFEYQRLPDAEITGLDVYVVELFPREPKDSAYSRIWVFVDKKRNVVLRSRYWDEAGVEVKLFAANPWSLRNFDGIWVPMESVMRNLLMDSYTRLVVTELVPNPTLDETVFDLRRLESF